MNGWSAAESVGQKQFGLISRGQALAAGVSVGSLYRAVNQGRLVAVASGLYRFGAVPPGWEQRALTPQLVRPGRSALSHWTAAWLHRLAGVRQPHRLDVSVSYDTTLTLENTDVHRVRQLRTNHRIGPYVVTSIGRTIVDLASVMRREALTFAFDSATARYPREMTALFEYVSTRPLRGRAGLTVLRELFAERYGVMLESPLESRVWTALVRSKLPLPVAQHPIGDVMRVDFVWPRERVMLHVDGRAFHASRAELDRDAGQRNQLAADWVSFVVTTGTLASPAWLNQLRAALTLRHPQRRLL